MELVFAKNVAVMCGLIKFYTHLAVNPCRLDYFGVLCDHGAGRICQRGNVIRIGWKRRVNSVA